MTAGPAGAGGPARRRHRRNDALLLRALALAFTGFVVLYIVIPVVVTLVMSFNDAAAIRFPIKAWSFRWYADFFASPQWMDALKSSVIIALGTTVLSTGAGVLAAWAFSRFTFPFRSAVYLAIMLPLFTPGVVLGLGVAMTFGDVSVFGVAAYGSHLLVMLAHSLWAMPLVFLLMEATFRSVDRNLIEASYDLGARPLRTFVEVVLPSVSTGIVSSALFAFVISLNEFIMALFLTTRDTQTLPVLMWLSLRSAGTPRLAVASIILAATVFVSLSLIIGWYVRQVRKA